MKRLPMTVTGGCQCGAVRYRTTALLDNAHICHCRMCQKAVGNLFAALVGAPNDELVWTRGTPATFASSDLAERGFCAQCGTPLFYRGKDSPRTGLTIGSLDDPSLAPPGVQVGMEERLPVMDSLCTLPNLGTTEDDMAQEVPLIATSNHQHPDHDTETWAPKMTASLLIQKIRNGFRYISPTIAATLFIHVVLEAKYEEGWAAAQGCNRTTRCALGKFNSVEFAVFGALVLSSFMLVQRGRPRWGTGVALSMTFLMGIFWLASWD